MQPDKSQPNGGRTPISLFQGQGVVDELNSMEPKAKRRAFSSFKNRILVSTLLVVAAVVIVIGVSLQVAIFPRLRGDSSTINNLKAIHLLCSLAVIALSWLFIERISKTITFPLRELTKRADQISREAGAGLLAVDPSESIALQGTSHADTTVAGGGDEIERLTNSFNRMLVHLKASEAQLRESEEKYRFCFDNNPSPVFVIDAENMMILDVNARAEEEYQFSREEMLGMSFADLGLGRDRNQTSGRIKHLIATEVAFLPVMQHQRKDGSVFVVSFQARISRFKNRPAIIVSVSDVTERLMKHTKFIQAGKMATLGEMATGIAHELNQPLNVIMIGCDYLTKKISLGEEVSVEDITQVAQEINASVQRASRIINHLREFGRQSDETMNPMDINVPVLNAFGLLGTQLDNRGIRLELKLDQELPQILGDPNRIEQVLINLVLNARDAMLGKEKIKSQPSSKPKILRIKSLLENNQVVVTVSDTGPGIPEAILPKIFDPFFTTKKIGEGTGLGLSISYGIMKDHRGAIEVESALDTGTTFKISFPVLTTGGRE